MKHTPAPYRSSTNSLTCKTDQQRATKQMSQAIRYAEQLEDPINAKLYLAPYIAAELRRLHDENKRMRNALQTIANIALMDSGHWAKTIEAEALAASRGHN